MGDATKRASHIKPAWTYLEIDPDHNSAQGHVTDSNTTQASSFADPQIYLLSDDVKELSRQDLQHHVWKMTLGGSLHFAPLSLPPPAGATVASQNIEFSVLDIGCASGIWATQFAAQYPQSTVTATDISPNIERKQPQPSNCEFIIANAQEKWDFGGKKFDYIHVRMMILGIRDWDAFLTQAFEHLKPGGWIELVELGDAWQSQRKQNGEIDEDPPLIVYLQTMLQGMRNMGIDVDIAHKNLDMAKKAGFVNVVQEWSKWPVGGWAKGSEVKKAGELTRENAKMYVRGIASTVWTKGMGWSEEKLNTVREAARLEIDDLERTNCCWVPVAFVCGQKPKDA